MTKLQPGRHYKVIQAFTDFDRRVHPVGERWQFLRDAFLPYDDGLTWQVQPDEGSSWVIRMWWDERGQLEVIENLDTYVQAYQP